MKGFQRNDSICSLCGLNCRLCPMYLGSHCPGCGGGAGNQSCKIARCSLQHQNVTYCFECASYPCSLYENADQYDSFITHYHMRRDMDKIQKTGIADYHLEQLEKADFLLYLLNNFNDGRKKNLFCIAVNLLPLQVIQTLRKRLEEDEQLLTISLKERAGIVAAFFQKAAKEQGIPLSLRKKQK